MHEHNITNEVIHQILHECEDSGIEKPKRIRLELGLLSGYKKESVLFYFDEIKNEYDILKKAKLEIIEVPGKIHCKLCNKEYPLIDIPIPICPKCNSSKVKIMQGKDIVITDIK